MTSPRLNPRDVAPLPADIDERQRPWLKPEQIPTRESCNPNCPDEAFLWMLVGLPGQNGAPLSWPIEYLSLVSRRMWFCGARPVDCDDDFKQAAAPTIKYRLPSNGDAHWLTSPGTFVDIDAPDPAAPGLKDVLDSMPPADQAAARAHLNNRFDDLRETLGLPPEAEERAQRVAYVKKDGTTVMTTRAQADAWNRKRRDR